MSAYVLENFEEFTWDCEGSGGEKCGEIKRAGFEDWANLPVGSSLTYTLSDVVSSAASGDFTVDASVATSWDDFRKSNGPEAPELIDPNMDNNTASDTDSVGFEADLSISTNGPETMVAGTEIEFLITVENDGPSDVASAVVEDVFPTSLPDVSWTCESVEGTQCTALGNGDINDTIDRDRRRMCVFVEPPRPGDGATPLGRAARRAVRGRGTPRQSHPGLCA